MPIHRRYGLLNVVLGVGDLRIATVRDKETNMMLVVVAQADSALPLDGRPLASDDIRKHKPSLTLSSVTKVGLGNFIDILQMAYSIWPEDNEVRWTSEVLGVKPKRNRRLPQEKGESTGG